LKRRRIRKLGQRFEAKVFFFILLKFKVFVLNFKSWKLFLNSSKDCCNRFSFLSSLLYNKVLRLPLKRSKHRIFLLQNPVSQKKFTEKQMTKLLSQRFRNENLTHDRKNKWIIVINAESDLSPKPLFQKTI